jgi:probable rRNA maturation factor
MIKATLRTATASFDDGASDIQTEPDDGGEPAEPGEPPEPEPLAIKVDSGVVTTIDINWLRSRLSAALQELARSIGRPIDRLTVRVVDDAAMSVLHARHRGQATTTDVLTFDASQSGAPIEADVAVCADEAVRRGLELDHAPEKELLLYALHGVMHCAGFDDQDDEAFERMHIEEDRILEAIGVGATFRREGKRP